jgi:hypothetical protein
MVDEIKKIMFFLLLECLNALIAVGFKVFPQNETFSIQLVISTRKTSFSLTLLIFTLFNTQKFYNTIIQNYDSGSSAIFITMFSVKYLH